MIDQAQKLRELQKSVRTFSKTNYNIISVTSGKGGTGKSFAAFYLSQFLAAKGERTLLLEFDHNLASLSYHLDFTPGNTLLDAFQGKVLFNEIHYEVSENLNIIFGESGKLQYPQNKISYVENFMETLRNNSSLFDFVIIDNGAGINTEIFETLRRSDLNLIVTLPDPVAVMDAYVLIKLMIKNNLKTEKGIVVNRCGSTTQGKETFNNLNKATLNFFNEELQFMGVLGEDKSMQQLRILGKEEKSENYGTGIISQFENLANGIINFKQLANNRHNTAANPPKKQQN